MIEVMFWHGACFYRSRLDSLRRMTMSLFARLPGQSWIRVVSDADWSLLDLWASLLADSSLTWEVKILK